MKTHACCLLTAFGLLFHAGARAQDNLLITEFMAANNAAWTDEDGAYPDWIELWNAGTNTVDLDGWFLTDNPTRLNKWRFPPTNLPPNRYLLVFASGKDRAVPGAPLHTSFNLNADGEYLALVDPHTNVVSAYAPLFPRQAQDVSFGIVTTGEALPLVAPDAPLRALVPADGALGSSWTAPEFDDSAWIPGTNGLGYDTGAVQPGEDTHTAIPFSGAWKYLVRTSDLGTSAWKGAGYDDSAWSAGAGPFTFPGDEPLPAGVPRGTTLPLTTGCLFSGVYVQTVYFRTTFTFAGPTNNVFLTVSNVVDDGAVFYLNGQELGGRLNLPAPPAAITWNTAATSATEGSLQVFGVAPANLVQGTNVLAVELHNTAGSSSDLVLGVSVSVRYVLGETAQPSTQHYPYTSMLGTEVQGPMFGRNSSCFARYRFDLADPAQIDRLTLNLHYDDGFAAFLNGVWVTARNAGTAGPLNPPPWNAAASAPHPDGLALSGEGFNLDSALGLLRAGTNVLAIHGLNTSPTNQDFLVLARLDAYPKVAAEPDRWRYFVQPTPGQPNLPGAQTLGAVITQLQFSPPFPADTNDLTITARVRPTFDAVTNVMLHYRVMFSNEVAVPMFDDGAHGDGAASDGVFGAAIPAAASSPGQMVRWYVTALDASGTRSREPLFAAPTGAPEYAGTVIANPAINTRLPVFQYFIQDTNWYKLPNNGPYDKNETNASVYYLGRFYDHVRVRIRGASGVLWKFPKQSLHFDFNPGHRFFYSPDRELQDEININALWVDKAYVRNNLSMLDVYRAAGVVYQETFFVLAYLNGALHSVASFVEEPDQQFLTRHGLDPEGAYYKMYNPLTDASPRPPFVPGVNPDTIAGVEKRTRRHEDNADLQAIVDGVKASNPNRAAFVFDHFDVPQVINYFAASVIIQDWDRYPKNTFMYRDTLGTRLWQIHPWDADLSWGYNGWMTDEITANHPTMSHPFYGDFQHGGTYGGTHVLNDAFYKTPALQAMFLRRLRTIIEQILQPPGTPVGQLKLEARIEAYDALMRAEVDADKQRWGLPFGTNQTFAQALGVIKNAYLAPRRTGLFVTYGGPGGLIPPTPFAYPTIHLGAIEFNPASGNQAQEYLQLTNPNPFAVEMSGWRLDGAVQFDFKPGTVMPSNSALYLSPDLVAFRTRTSGPRGGQGLFMLGNYQGQMSARGETLRLYDAGGRLVQATNYPGLPSLAQRHLRVTEIMFNPTPLAGNTNDAQEFEYLELKNTSTNATLDLSGVRFTDGIVFSFSAGAVPTLGPGESMVVVRNLAAFTARYGGRPNLAGQYFGGLTNLLDNAGERLRLVDAAGEEILDFTFNDAWHGLADGLGFSLVATDEQAEPDAWNDRTQWRVSAELGGSPGLANPPPLALAPIVINEVLTRSDFPPPTDSIELHNPTATHVNLGGWFLSDDFNSPRKYRIPDGTNIAAGAYLVFDETQFNATPGVPPSFALSSLGDEVWLFSADPEGNLTGYAHGFAFGAAEDGVSFGRHMTSVGEEHLTAQSARTPGAANAGPRVGPVVISEVLYHPPDLADGADNQEDEFIELENVTGEEQPLYDVTLPQSTWRLRGGVDFDLPQGTELAPGARLLLVSFDPTNTAKLAAFRSRYSVPADVAVLGPYSGKLDNAADTLRLYKPGPLEPDLSQPYVLVEEIRYQDAAPWPGGADGWGLSLQRLNSSVYGNDPANWTAAPPTAATPTGTGLAPVIIVQPVGRIGRVSEPASLSVTATGSPPLGYQWRFRGANLPGATHAVLAFAALEPGHAGDYQVLVFNPAGSVLSTNATLTVIMPPLITRQPTNQIVRPGTNATFSVAAFSPSATALTYQWRWNETALPGRTHATLTLTNVQIADSGAITVDVTDGVDTTRSASATLHVVVPPGIGVQPVAQSVPVGGTATFSVWLTNGTLPINYQWRLASTPLTNMLLHTHASFFTLRNVQMNQAGNYRVVMTNIAQPGGLASTTAALTVLADADADGIPDAWTQQYFGHATGQEGDFSRADDDADGDTMTNGEEYIAGTNPTNALSYLKVEPVIRGNPRTLQFLAISNRTYSVEWTDTLGTEPWQKLADVVARTNSRMETVLDPQPVTHRLYRLVTPRQP